MSCSCDEPSVCNTAIRTARKEHRCCEGDHHIAPGERYAYTSGIWDGSGGSFKRCMTCHVIAQAANDDAWSAGDCGPCFGGLQEFIADTYDDWSAMARSVAHARRAA